MSQKPQQNKPGFALQNRLFSQGYKYIVGIDEAGRGCLAGPVSIAAYVITQESILSDSVKDSKLLSAKQRQSLYALLNTGQFRNLLVPAGIIDQLGIAKAIESAIAEFITELASPETFFLIDGQFSRKFGPQTMQIIKGDRDHYAIACASIIAKVARDNLMADLAKEFSQYGFEIHKGYGTKLHLAKISEFGPCELHRKSFKPISGYYANTLC